MAKAKGRRARANEDKISAAQRRSDEAFRTRNPEAARAERALRKANAQAHANWRHKANGTVQTHARAAQARQGALARLYRSGAIDVHQLGAALEIASVHEKICRGVSVRTASLETRIDCGRADDAGFFEALGAVRWEMAYTRWRGDLPVRLGTGAAGPILAMVCDDIGVERAAREWRMHRRTARRLLIDALDHWPDCLFWARDEVSDEDLERMHARLS